MKLSILASELRIFLQTRFESDNDTLINGLHRLHNKHEESKTLPSLKSLKS